MEQIRIEWAFTQAVEGCYPNRGTSWPVQGNLPVELTLSTSETEREAPREINLNGML